MSILNDFTFMPRDFEGMKFNPKKLSNDANLLLEFSQLQRFRSFLSLDKEVPHLNRNKIIRYICFVYDPASPLYKEVPDEFKRKVLGAHHAGIDSDPDEGTFDTAWVMMMNGEIDIVNTCIVDFVMQFNSPDYALLVSMTDQLYKKLLLMGSIVRDDKKNDLEVEKTRGEVYKSTKILHEDINALRKKILNESNPALNRELYRVVSEEVIQRLNLSPEARIKTEEKKQEKKQLRKQKPRYSE